MKTKLADISACMKNQNCVNVCMGPETTGIKGAP